ncbi:MAG: glycosyltransferase [Candidatus Lokiarchaeota archaeon]|nr:glycosyltransferase [Candidatus Lokiarchaeota archaeon]
MKLCFFVDDSFAPFALSFNKEGHDVIINKFSIDSDVIISESYFYMYEILRNLKQIKKNNIKIINFILDIPPWRLKKSLDIYSLVKYIKQLNYHYSHRAPNIYNILNDYLKNMKKTRAGKINKQLINKIFNTYYNNYINYQKNYRSFLKKNDIVLSISRNTQYSAKKFLNIDSKICYFGVNSDLLSKIPEYPIKYDVINISRVVKTKRQNLIVEAAKKLNLKVAIFGKLQDKTIKLDCPVYYFPNHIDVLKELNKTRFYVDASIFEGFGMTPLEAAFLNKITIASDTFVHKEILGDYPLYFKRDNLKDLVEKMKMVLNGDFILNEKTIKILRNKFSFERCRKNLLSHIESLF